MYIHILEKSYNNILIKIELRGLSPGQKNCDFFRPNHIQLQSLYLASGEKLPAPHQT